MDVTEADREIIGFIRAALRHNPLINQAVQQMLAEESAPVKEAQTLDSVAQEAYELYRQRIALALTWEQQSGERQSAWREIVGFVLSKARVSL